MIEAEAEFESDKRWCRYHPNLKRDSMQLKKLILLLSIMFISFGLEAYAVPFKPVSKDAQWKCRRCGGNVWQESPPYKCNRCGCPIGEQ